MPRALPRYKKCSSGKPSVGVSSGVPRTIVVGASTSNRPMLSSHSASPLAMSMRVGLASGVYTADLSRALRALRGIKAGTVWVNRFGRTADYVIPTGGYHSSGIGKDLGRQAVEANMRFKSVLVDFSN